MGRLINTESANKERLKLTRSVILALRELMKQSEPDETSRDLAAYIGLTLSDIFKTVETSISAWEKKGYWVKADRYRMEWLWADKLSGKMCQAVLDDNWADVAGLSAQIAQKFMKVKVPIRHKLGTPWVGAWDKLNK